MRIGYKISITLVILATLFIFSMQVMATGGGSDWDKSSLVFDPGDIWYECEPNTLKATIANSGEDITEEIWKVHIYSQDGKVDGYEYIIDSDSKFNYDGTDLHLIEIPLEKDFKQGDYWLKFERPEGHPGGDSGGKSGTTYVNPDCDEQNPPELDFVGDINYYCDQEEATATVKNTGETVITGGGYMLERYEGNDEWAPYDVGGAINNLSPGDSKELTVNTSNLDEGQYRFVAYDDYNEGSTFYSQVFSVDRSVCEDLSLNGDGAFSCSDEELSITVTNTGKTTATDWEYIVKEKLDDESWEPISDVLSVEELEVGESTTLTYDTKGLEGVYKLEVYKHSIETYLESDEIVLDRSPCEKEPDPEEPEEPEEPKGELTYEGDGTYYCESDEIKITVKNTGEGTAEEWSYGLLKIEDGERTEALPGPYSIESLESGETYTITMEVSDLEDGVYQFTLFNYETGEFSSEVELDRSECEEEPEEPEEPKEEEPKEDEEKPEEPEEEQEEPKEEVESDQDEEEEEDEEDVLPQTGFNLPLWNYLLGGLVAASGVGVLVFRRPKFLTSDV
ncbi:hypothetical protein [Aquisalibacillus elongatus]|uniref:LPXTG-motif cell wall-anchored protein n=1 Tax=Aquisalibacillus elongatus TaxID=485577 RepID=A0A3N5CB35_9BACI|nr:hypothetical protein [Aquisalibacillus elongatus]RPF54031.1 hypothetical protein EDC24_1219 [Aquisalibacillus elongatus]